MSFNYCGTQRGVEEHIRDGDDCRVCKEWLKNGATSTGPNGQQTPAAKRVKASPATPRKVAECGTNGAYQRHRRNGETPCEPCVEARRVYNREKKRIEREKAGVKPRQILPREHGTLRGYRQHKSLGEPKCDPCKEAHNADERARRAKRAAAWEAEVSNA